MPFYDFTSEDGETIERFFRIADRPDTVTEDGVEYHHNFVSSSRTQGAPSPAGWPLRSKAAGFINQPGEMERHVAADKATGVNCDYVERNGCVDRVFDSPGQQEKWAKANHLFNDS